MAKEEVLRARAVFPEVGQRVILSRKQCDAALLICKYQYVNDHVIHTRP